MTISDMTAKTEILLAAYNGEKYLREQIESILDQDCDSWFLTVSDDGSSDKTSEILDFYVENYPEQIRRVKSGTSFGNAKDHFFFLLKESAGKEVMFCDQDDVWMKDKVSSQSSLMKEDVPCLVCSDLSVVGEDLSEIDPSMRHYQGIGKDDFALSHLLFRNAVSGCGCLMNRKLVEKILEIKDTDNVIMHDYWAALTASLCGEIVVMERSTVLYRQHSGNSLGAQKQTGIGYVTKKLRGASWKNSVDAKKRQAKELIDTYSPQNELLNDFAKPKSGTSFYLEHRTDAPLFVLLGFLIYG